MKWIPNLWNRFKKLSIVRKMILAYILLVFLPVVLFGSIFLYMLLLLAHNVQQLTV